MQLTIGYSSCPNDTFIFDALIHHKIDTKGIDFKLSMADVKELNAMAFESELDITKLSFHAFAYLTETYSLLDAGAALGNNCGPLLIAKRPIEKEEIENCSIAIPGKYTTANFLLSLAYPNIKNKKEMLFDEIETAVLTEACEAGLIIHENRFTYQDKGLHKILDLGAYWEEAYKLPIPLGGIVIKKDLDPSLKELVNDLVTESVRFAFAHPESSKDYILKHAQEMDETVVQKHIGLYVNKYSQNLGIAGRKAIEKLFEVAQSKGIVPQIENSFFLTN